MTRLACGHGRPGADHGFGCPGLPDPHRSWKSGGIGGFYGNGTGSFHALAYGVDVVRDAAGDPVRLTVDDPATSVEPASTAKKEMLSYAAPAEDLLRAWRWEDWNEMTVRCTGRYPVLASWVNGVKLYEIDTGAISHPGYDRDAARASLRRILAWDFDKLVVAHGPIVTSGAREIVENAFSWLTR